MFIYFIFDLYSTWFFKYELLYLTGGILGLFTGMSILSMVELVFWILRLVLKNRPREDKDTFVNKIIKIKDQCDYWKTSLFHVMIFFLNMHKWAQYLAPFQNKSKINIFHLSTILSGSKSSVSVCIREAGNHWPLTGAVPLLTHMGTLGCWVSPLAQSAPP